MKLKDNIKKNISNIKIAIKRFPISIIFAFMAFVFFVIRPDKNNLKGINYPEVFFYLCVAGIIVYAFVQLFHEGIMDNAKKDEEKKRAVFISVFLYIFSIALMYILFDILSVEEFEMFRYNNTFIYFGTLFGLGVGCSFISKIFYHEDFVPYVFKIIISLVISFSYSLILYIGLFAIISALDKLLGINFGHKIYSNMAILVFISFNSLVFFSGFPKVKENFSNFSYQKPLQIAIKFILIPVICIYMAILYIYFGKSLILRKLPDGIIVNLVMWYSIISVFIIFFMSKLKGKWLNEKFRRFYSLAMIPLIFMMFFALYLRVREYGFTENRYFVMLAGVWVLLSFIYYIIYTVNSNIFVPIILSILILFATLGPLSAYRVAAKSQNKMLKNLLIKNQMIDGKDIVPKKDIRSSDRKRISSIVRYMLNNHKPYELSYLPKDFNKADFENIFGFKEILDEGDENLRYYFNGPNTFDISGFNHLYVIDYWSLNENSHEEFKMAKKGHIITIYKKADKDVPIAQIDLDEVKKKFKSMEAEDKDKNSQNLILEGEINSRRYKIIFDNLNLNEDESDIDCRFYLLIN